MNDLHRISTVGSSPALCDELVSAQALALARVLYPDEPFHELRAIEITLMEYVGAVLPKMPDRLPSVQHLQAMDATTRSFRLMILIAALAIQVEMLRTGMHIPADRSRPMKTQLRNARRRLRRACLHAELSHLWRDGRWKIGGLMQLLSKDQTGTEAS